MVSESLLNQSVAKACFRLQARSLCSTSLLPPQVLCNAGPSRNRSICVLKFAIAQNPVSKSNRPH